MLWVSKEIGQCGSDCSSNGGVTLGAHSRCSGPLIVVLVIEDYMGTWHEAAVLVQNGRDCELELPWW